MIFIANASKWATENTINNAPQYWVARGKVAKELPLLNIKPSTVYRHYKILNGKGLINYIKIGRKDYVSLTDKSKSYLSNSKNNDRNLQIDIGHNQVNDQNQQIDTKKLVNGCENGSNLNTTDTNISKNNTIKIKSVSFEGFYESYGISNKKVAAEQAWVRLTEDERSKAVNSILSFNSALPDYHDKPLASSYLKDKRWNDELTPWKSPMGRQRIPLPEERRVIEARAREGFSS